MMTDEQSYELMKAIFTDFGIRYEEGVPEDKVGFWVSDGNMERKLSDNFLKGFNREGSESNV